PELRLTPGKTQVRSVASAVVPKSLSIDPVSQILDANLDVDNFGCLGNSRRPRRMSARIHPSRSNCSYLLFFPNLATYQAICILMGWNEVSRKISAGSWSRTWRPPGLRGAKKERQLPGTREAAARCGAEQQASRSLAVEDAAEGRDREE